MNYKFKFCSTFIFKNTPRQPSKMHHSLEEALRILQQLDAGGMLSYDEGMLVEMLSVLRDVAVKLAMLDEDLESAQSFLALREARNLMVEVDAVSISWKQAMAAMARMLATVGRTLETITRLSSTLCNLAENVSVRLLNSQVVFQQYDLQHEIALLQRKRASISVAHHEMLQDQDENVLGDLGVGIQNLNLAHAP
jgi:L-alanine-DL-glutamate epimerase-like enolase superfamily enzyme